jgi:hypothetical protein
MGKLTAKLAVEIPLTVKELAEFESMLEKSGMTPGDYVRRVIAGESAFRLGEQKRRERLEVPQTGEQVHACKCDEAVFPLAGQPD